MTCFSDIVTVRIQAKLIGILFLIYMIGLLVLYSAEGVDNPVGAVYYFLLFKLGVTLHDGQDDIDVEMSVNNNMLFPASVYLAGRPLCVQETSCFASDCSGGICLPALNCTS
jgi:uncharacterized membrane protein YbjE (DUF340 family)